MANAAATSGSRRSGSDLKLRPARASAFMRSGVQEVFRVTTKLGKTVDATANHPLLTFDGWRELRELEVGSRIAVPRELPRPARPQEMADDELVMLAALIADGNLTEADPRFYVRTELPDAGRGRAQQPRRAIGLATP